MDQCPASEFVAWQKYYRQEPWGPWRDNLHSALTIQAIYNAMTGKKVKADEFMYRPPMTDAERHARIRAALDGMTTVTQGRT